MMLYMYNRVVSEVFKVFAEVLVDADFILTAQWSEWSQKGQLLTTISLLGLESQSSKVSGCWFADLFVASEEAILFLWTLLRLKNSHKKILGSACTLVEAS